MSVPALIEFYDKFRRFKNSDLGKCWSEERLLKEYLVSLVLSKENLETASQEQLEVGLVKVLASLWSFRVWTVREHHASDIVRINGVEKLREAFLDLLYGSNPIEKRFDRFLKEIKGIGVSGTTEILCIRYPSKYPIWNRRSIEAIQVLGLEEEAKKTTGLRNIEWEVNGEIYVKITGFLEEVKGKIETLTGDKIDFLMLDEFLYYVRESSMGRLKEY